MKVFRNKAQCENCFWLCLGFLCIDTSLLIRAPVKYYISARFNDGDLEYAEAGRKEIPLILIRDLFSILMCKTEFLKETDILFCGFCLMLYSFPGTVVLDLGRDRVNFLHSSYSGAMFWICVKNRSRRDVLVAAEQWLHRIKAFSASCITPPPRRLGVDKNLEWSIGEHSQNSWPQLTKGIPHTMLLDCLFSSKEPSSY